MKRDIDNSEWMLRLCDSFECLGKELSHAFAPDVCDNVATYDDAMRQISEIYGRIFPGRSLFSSIVLPSNANPARISPGDKQDIAQLTAKVLEPEFNGIRVHVTAETDREISAKAPKRRRLFGHEGNGLKGPRTTTMLRQRDAFFSFLESHPECDGHSRISRAHEFWNMNRRRFEAAAKATGEARGYASHKQLAAAR